MTLSKEANQVLNFLASMPSGSDTVTREVLRELLLHTGGSMLARGYLYNIKTQSLGAGVYKITLQLANP